MSRSNWGNITAAIGLVTLTVAQYPTETTNSRESSHDGQRAESDNASWRPYPNLNADACYRASDKDQADLCAQWRAALAAEESARQADRAIFWSIVASALSAATVIGLIVTIWQTHGALREARRGNRINLNFERRSRRESRDAAVAQQAALEIARSSANAATVMANNQTAKTLAQLRAYVDVCDDKTAIDPKPEWANAGDIAYKLAFALKNFGATPAKNCKCRFAMKCYEYPMPSRYEDFTFDDPFEPIFDISPGGRFTKIVPWSAPIDLHDAITSESHALYIFVEFQYDDIFGDEHLFKGVFSTHGKMLLDRQLGLLALGYVCR